MSRYRKRQVSKKFQVILLLVLTAVCSIFIIGCGSPAVNSSRSDRLVDFIVQDPKTFNPILTTDATSSGVLGYIFSSLLKTNGLTAELEPELAESWAVAPNGLEVTFTLRDNLKWSDGQPLTVDDVVFTFNLIFDERIPTSSRDVLRVGKKRELPKLEKLDARRIKFTISEPFAPFVRYMGGTSILPKHILEKTLQENDAAGKPKFLETWSIKTPLDQIVGSGSYMFADYRPGERFIYKRNPNYWDQPKPFIKNIVLQILDSSDTALLKFRSRELDIFDLGARVKDFQLLKSAEARDKFKIYNGGAATGELFVMFNLNQGRDAKTNQPFVEPKKSKWFNDVNFRRAIAHAIDRQTMVTNLYVGLGEEQNSPISVPSPYYLSPAKGLKVYEYNPTKAKKILTDAGYRYNSQNQLLDADGNLVRFTLLTNAGSNPVRGQVGSQIKNDLENIGITVDFTGIDFNILVDKLDNSKQWDAIILGFTGGIEPHGSINLWSTTGNLHMFNKGADEGQPPIPGYKVADWEKQIENLMIDASQQVDENKRKAIYAQFQQLVQEQLPLIHLVTPLSLSAVRDRIQGVKFSPIGGALWNLDELTLSAN
ncbi:ABC-type dipeptide transport system, periplasmic component [Synechococcus sp. PCC 7502]|uniref:ABC transporter substrate-binding protein n=1 Tax=Synechococcus sp. PCC 7502 TaxID=1173263 RepID=UPI00029FC6EC|nr:ABC transporter substrate-binding protein [Synechococcus sp. PCC 7502]AFY72895.1 ABC-type dipeptide transport system, periplasmic component [Synechococcus sp. PCC 7502]